MFYDFELKHKSTYLQTSINNEKYFQFMGTVFQLPERLKGEKSNIIISYLIRCLLENQLVVHKRHWEMESFRED